MKSQLMCLAKRDFKIATPEEIPYILVNTFDDVTVDRFYREFIKMTANPEVLVIPIVINSFGGQCHSLLSMLDIIESSIKPVATIAIGKAMSCGAFLLAAGDNGMRFVAPNTDVMLHEVSSIERGKVSNIVNDVASTKRLNDKLFKFLAKQAKKKDLKFFIKELDKKSNVDWYLTAEETKKLGIANHVTLPIFTRQE